MTVSLAGVVSAEWARADSAPAQAQDALVNMVLATGGALQRRRTGVAVMLDELHEAAPVDLRAITRAHQAAMSDGLPVVVVGAGLPTLPAKLMAAVTYAERYRYEELGFLGAAETAVALLHPARTLGVDIEAPALERLVDLAGGYPYLIQLYGRTVWTMAAGADRIVLEHVESAVPMVWRELDRGAYGGRWANIPMSERLYLAAMASLGLADVESAAVARTLGRTSRELSPIRQRLLNRGLITAGAGTVGFALPTFGDYVRYRAQRDGIRLITTGREAGAPNRRGANLGG